MNLSEQNELKELKKNIVGLVETFIALYKSSGVKIEYQFNKIGNQDKHHSQERTYFIFAISFEHRKKANNNQKDFCVLVSKKQNKKIIVKDNCLFEIEKILKRTLKKLHKKTPERVCRNNILDYLKFVFLPKYKYKKRIFGIDINIIRIAIFVVLAITFALLIFQTRHSYFLEHGYYPIW